MKSSARKFWSNVAGTAAIEFAMLAVPFLGVVTTGVEVGRAYWTLEALQDSAIQGARCIGVGASSCSPSGSFDSTSAVAHVQSVAQAWGIAVPAESITATQDTNCGNVPGFSEVRISYAFSPITGKLIPALNNLPLSASSCFPHKA
jgi:Flp pilus assembly protein TadG